MNEYMEIANRLAGDNLIDNDGGPFGACIVKDGKVIGKGDNKVLVNHDPTAHAEVMAIRDACKNLNTHDLKECIIYTTTYPCPMCLSAIIWANIDKVYYGNTSSDAEAIGFRDQYIYDIISDLKDGKDSSLDLKCINREETIKVFNEYIEKMDKTIY